MMAVEGESIDRGRGGVVLRRSCNDCLDHGILPDPIDREQEAEDCNSSDILDEDHRDVAVDFA
jgi:hypothetical protein